MRRKEMKSRRVYQNSSGALDKHGKGERVARNLKKGGTAEKQVSNEGKGRIPISFGSFSGKKCKQGKTKAGARRVVMKTARSQVRKHNRVGGESRLLPKIRGRRTPVGKN